MTYQFPTYYRDFQCISRNCPDTCCGGWNIAIDPKSLERYRRVLLAPHDNISQPSQAFLRRFKKSINFSNSTIRLSKRYCPLLTKEKLCGMYLHLGKDSLCRTCRTYPRHQEEFGNLREISLSLSCPEAARIILSQKTRPQMQVRHTSKKCPSNQQIEEDLLTWMAKARGILLDILWTSDYSFTTSISMTLAFSHDLQRRHSQGRFYEDGRFCLEKASKDLDRLAQKYLAVNGADRFTQTYLTERISFSSSPMSSPTASQLSHRSWLSGLLTLYSKLEPVVETWPRLMKLCRNSQNLHVPFSQADSAKDRPDSLCLPEKQLFTYFIQVYFLGAIYDDNLFDKVQFAAISWLTICLLAESLKNSSCPQISNSNPQAPNSCPQAPNSCPQAPNSCPPASNSNPSASKPAQDSSLNPSFDSFLIQAAYLYSRQVENHDPNLNTLFGALHTERAFQLLPFLSFLNTQSTI